MHRTIMSIAAAAFLAGCSDLSSAPESSLRAPAAAAFDLEGDPPPPPVSGDGLADFSTFQGDDAATQCSVSQTFAFSYQYFVNKTLKNAYLHVQRTNPGHEFKVHQTSTKTEVNGTITGDGFSFAIAEVLGGSIINETGTRPRAVTLQLTGTLTTPQESCTVNAQLTLRLVVDSPDILIGT